MLLSKRLINSALLIGLFFCWASFAQAQQPLRIGLMTMEPGEVFWERFGHNAIVVVDTKTGNGISYNYGFFDLSEPSFYRNFVRGRMNYQLIALPIESDLASYQQEGRGVTLQWLNFNQQQAQALAAALADNAKPENSRYAYDYYTANCSTRVRDMLDTPLDSLLKQQLSGRSQGNTYRSESVRLAWPATWMAIGFHLGLAGAADRPLSRWEEAFIPMRLRDSLREVDLIDGQPLVSQEIELLPHLIAQPALETPRWRVPALFGGIALAFGILGLGRRQPRLLAGLALPVWTIAGLFGIVMLFIWLGSAHVFGHANENLLLLNPLCLLLVPGGWRVLRGKTTTPSFRLFLWIIAGGAAIAGFLKFLPFRPQENVEWVLLLLPMHWALARVFSPKKT